MPATLPISNAAALVRADGAGDVDDRVGVVDQPLERVAVCEVASDPVDAVAVGLLAPGQRLDLMAGGERDVDQMRADEAGAAGDRQPHRGDQGLSSAASNASLDGRVAEALDHRIEQWLRGLRRSAREIGKTLRAACLLERLDDLGARLVVEQVGLGQRDDLRLVVEAGAVAVELAADDAPGLDRVVAGAVDQVEQQPRALDMAEEAVADPGAFGRALDQAGDVGERRTRGPCGGRRRAAGEAS